MNDIRELERKIEELTSIVQQQARALNTLTGLVVVCGILGAVAWRGGPMVVWRDCISGVEMFWGTVIGLVLLAVETASIWLPILLVLAVLLALGVFLDRAPKKKNL